MKGVRAIPSSAVPGRARHPALCLLALACALISPSRAGPIDPVFGHVAPLPASLPRPSAAQLQSIDHALEQSALEASLHAAWQVAHDQIRPVVLFISCYKERDAWAYLKSYQHPGVGSVPYYLAPYAATRYHDPGQCLTVRRIHAVAWRDDGALEFRVLFGADDSDEEADRTFSLLREPDGRWLFERGGF